MAMLLTPNQVAAQLGIACPMCDAPGRKHNNLRDCVEFWQAQVAAATAAERARCAAIARQDSVLSWIGGSTGCATQTAANIAAEIEWGTP
jgi:hypothetical protein